MTMNPRSPRPTVKQRIQTEIASGRPVVAFILGYVLAIIATLIGR